MDRFPKGRLSQLAPSRRASRWGWALIALAGVVLFCALGVWQLGRGREKQALVAQAESTLTQRVAVPLQQASDGDRTRHLDWAAGSGAFTWAEPLLLDNQTRGGRAGFRVYRVFHPDGPLADTVAGEALLVDLGWLPLGPKREMPRLHFPPSNRVDLRGLLAPPPSTGLALGEALTKIDGAWLMTRIDRDAIGTTVNGARRLKIAPRVLRLDPALPIGFERDLDVLPNTLPPSRHFGYALTWFALAATVVVTYLVLQRRPRNEMPA